MKKDKLNYLIVVPRIVNTVGDWYQFPLGIAYISSSLSQAGFKVIPLNLNNEAGSVYDIMSHAISRQDIDVVMTGGLTGQYGAIRHVVEVTKKIKPTAVTIIGGGIVTSAPEHAMQALEFGDFGVIGEGEIIICELCAALERKRSGEDVPGLVYKKGNSFLRSSGKPAPVDLAKIPIPDYKGFGMEQLLRSVPNIIGMSEYNTLPIITSRSCPFRCTFCFHTSGQKYRQRSLDDVFAEIDYLVREFGVRYLSIQDELFGYDMDWVKSFCQRIKPYGIKWLANFRVSDVTRELVSMVKESNCAVMAFGVESADNTVLKSMRKGITIEQTERALQLAYDAGMAIQGVLIFGDVAETMETAKTSIRWWKEHIHYELELSAIITYPGTALYRDAISRGIITDPVQYIKNGCPLVRLSAMSDQEYAWLFEQLLSLPRLTHKMPVNAVVVEMNYHNATMDIEGECVSCGARNRWDKSRLFIRETLTCNKCGRKHIAPLPAEVMHRLDRAIDGLVDQYRDVAFWGINSYIYALFGQLGSVRRKGVICVDKSVLRQGISLAGHKVQSPEAIHAENIKCVVVAVVQYYASLKKPIADEFPKVEKILSISELLACDSQATQEHEMSKAKPPPLR